MTKGFDPIHNCWSSSYQQKTPRYTFVPGRFYYLIPPLGGSGSSYFAISIATATCTVAPTIGLLPIPMNPIIST